MYNWSVGARLARGMRRVGNLYRHVVKMESTNRWAWDVQRRYSAVLSARPRVLGSETEARQWTVDAIRTHPSPTRRSGYCDRTYRTRRNAWLLSTLRTQSNTLNSDWNVYKKYSTICFRNVISEEKILKLSAVIWLYKLYKAAKRNVH